MLEWNLRVQSDSGRLDELQHLREWYSLYSDSLGMSTRAEGQKDRNAHDKLETLLRSTGFDSIITDAREVPASPWSAGNVQILHGIPLSHH